MGDIMYKVENVWKDWRVTRLIGEGSSGKVYEIVRDNMGIEEHSALKVITIPQSQTEVRLFRNEGMDDKSVTEYFRSIVDDFIHEISIMSKLKGNPNVVAYEDYQVVEHKNELGWDILIRMELLTPLPDVIGKQQLNEDEVIELGIEMCEALSVCHKNKIIHRDIKYDNIFISARGVYKLGDFGVARTIEKTSGNFSVKGTYTYMAPEVYKGEPYGIGADIYSLGMVLYRLLNCNREPFLPLPPNTIKLADRDNALVERMQGKAFNLPVNADKRLGEIILKACAFKSQDRFSSADEFKAELKKVKANLLKRKSNPDAIKEDNCIVDSDRTENAIDEKFEGNKSNNCDRTVSAFGSFDNSKNTYVAENKKIGKPLNEVKAQSKIKSKKVGIVAACCSGIALIATVVFIITGVLMNNDIEDNNNSSIYSSNLSDASETEDSSENNTTYVQIDEETKGIQSDVTVEVLDTTEDNGITIDSVNINYYAGYFDAENDLEAISIQGECHLIGDFSDIAYHGGTLLNEQGESCSDFQTIASENDFELRLPKNTEPGVYTYNFYIFDIDENKYDATVKFRIY